MLPIYTKKKLIIVPHIKHIALGSGTIFHAGANATQMKISFYIMFLHKLGISKLNKKKRN